MLNSIGLDNDGIEAFIAHHLALPGRPGDCRSSSASPAHDYDEFVAMAARLDDGRGRGGDRAEHFLPERVGGVDFGTDPAMCRRVVAGVRERPAAGRSWPS